MRKCNWRGYNRDLVNDKVQLFCTWLMEGMIQQTVEMRSKGRELEH